MLKAQNVKYLLIVKQLVEIIFLLLTKSSIEGTLDLYSAFNIQMQKGIKSFQLSKLQSKYESHFSANGV